MKRNLCYLGLAVLVLLISAPYLFAQRQLKNVPKVLSESKVAVRVKPARPVVPQGVNRSIADAAFRRGVTTYMGTGVTADESSSQPTKLPGGTPPGMPPSEPPSRSFLEETPENNDTNLTGMQVLQTYFPAWRQGLGGMFSNEQLDIVESAIGETDDWLFVRGEDGALQLRNPDEWDYEARFCTLLQDSGVAFTEQQLNQLLGENRVRGFTLRGVLKTASLQGFMMAYGKLPRDRITDKNKLIPPDHYTPAQQAEVNVGAYYARVVGVRHCPPAALPVINYIKELRDKYRTRAEAKTPEQYLEELEQFVEKYGRFPRSEIVKDGKTVSPSGFTPEEKAESQLAHGVNGFLRNAKDKQSPVYGRLQQLKEQYRQKAVPSTPEQVLADVEAFYNEHGRMPISRQNPANAEELAERNLAQRINAAIKNTDPAYTEVVARLRALKEANRARAVSLSDDELLAKVSEFVERCGRWPRRIIRREGTILSLAQASPAEQEEIQLGRAANKRLQVYDATRSPALQQLAEIKETYRQHAVAKAPAEHLADLQRFIAIHQRYPSANYKPNSTPAQRSERALAANVNYNIRAFPEDPAVQQMAAIKEQYRRRAMAMTHQELYEKLLENIHQNHRLTYDKTLYKSMWGRLNRVPRGGVVEDPYLQKIYELQQWSERVKRGEVDWGQMPGLLKKHRRTIGEMRRAAAQGTLQSVTGLPSAEQQAIEEMADKMFTLWEDFETEWLPNNQKYVIMTPDTRTALETVRNTVHHQVPGAENTNISEILDSLDSMSLGNIDRDYSRVIYRGTNPRLPRAEDFHNVLEIQGLPRAQIQRAIQPEVKTIELDGDETMVYNLLLSPGVTDKELAAVIDTLIPPGWEIRMGAHEILSEIQYGKVHFHIESVAPTTEENAMDISHVVHVDISSLTPGKNPQQVAKTVRYLFSTYLNPDGFQGLEAISRVLTR